MREHEDRVIGGTSPNDVVIELSSAGLRKPMADDYPSALLLDRVLDAGFDLTTASRCPLDRGHRLTFEHLVVDLDARGFDRVPG